MIDLTDSHNSYLTADEIISVKCDAEEQETTFTISRGDEFITVYCCDNTMLTKFKKLVKSNPDDYKCRPSNLDKNGVPTGYFITFPADLLSFRKGKKTMSEEQKQAASMRFKKMWSDKNSQT